MSKEPESPETMDLKSLDIAQEKQASLRALFPSVFTETKNEKGELVESVDFEKLKAEIGMFSDVFEARRERYGVDWPGKKDCMKLIQDPSVATLKPAREESVNFDTTENLFIEGDNLEVLKLLLKSYYGKVKMIYIDPPYNTGKEFIYPDKYAESLDTYLAYAGLVDDEGKKFATNTPNEGRFHTKWLNMMYPRIKLARTLLNDRGVMFITIDDNEVANLRRFCDEIFGEENFVTSIAWQKKVSPSNDATWFSSDHDHILVYAKDKITWRPNRLPMNVRQKGYYTNPDNDPRGPWNSATYTCNKNKDERPNLYYPLINPNTGEEVWPKETAVWAYSKEMSKSHAEKDLIYWGKDGNSKSPRQKKFLTEAKGVVPRTVWLYPDVGHTQEATKVLVELINDIKFETPKPPRLIKHMLEIGTNESEHDIVLDFFAGSCSTAQAVIEENARDRGNRKFVMIQLPEPCSENSTAFRTGFKNIADIGKERIRRVIKNIEEENDADKKDETLPGMQEEIPELDLGFRVLKLNKSNFRIWDGSNPDIPEDELTKQLELHIDHIDSKGTQEDILFELLLKEGFMPTEDIEKRKLVGKNVYSISDGDLLICLEDEITPELIDAVAEAEPLRFICLDRGFHGNDQLKANTVQTFAARNQGREKAEQIVFRTV